MLSSNARFLLKVTTNQCLISDKKLHGASENLSMHRVYELPTPVERAYAPQKFYLFRPAGLITDPFHGMCKLTSFIQRWESFYAEDPLFETVMMNNEYYVEMFSSGTYLDFFYAQPRVYVHDDYRTLIQDKALVRRDKYEVSTEQIEILKTNIRILVFAILVANYGKVPRDLSREEIRHTFMLADHFAEFKMDPSLRAHFLIQLTDDSECVQPKPHEALTINEKFLLVSFLLHSWQEVDN
jgi:hypothetical protein